MSKNSISKRPDGDNYGFDLVASGSAGQWRVFIDETHTGPQKWFAQIQGPSIYFSFEIPSAKTIDSLVHFLLDKSNRSLRLGHCKRTPVTLIRDDEYADRCFLVVGTRNGAVVRYAIAGTDLAKLTEALRQTTEELEREGLLS